jgi:uncharacterized membrane protein
MDKKIKNYFSHIGREPYTDWPVIVIIFLIITIVFLARGYLLHKDLDNKLSVSISGMNVVSTSTPIDVSSISKIINFAKSKADDRTEILRKFTPPTDPSL